MQIGLERVIHALVVACSDGIDGYVNVRVSRVELGDDRGDIAFPGPKGEVDLALLRLASRAGA